MTELHPRHFNSTRLLHLITVLERVARERLHFDMSEWATACGTPACALGHAAADPEFQEQGLRLHNTRKLWFPVFEGLEGYAAAARFFGVTHEASHYLFLSSNASANTLVDVIERVQAVIAARGDAPPS